MLAVYLSGIKNLLAVLAMLVASALPIIPVDNLYSESAYVGRYFFHISLLLIVALISLSRAALKTPVKKNSSLSI